MRGNDFWLYVEKYGTLSLEHLFIGAWLFKTNDLSFFFNKKKSVYLVIKL